MNTKEQKAEKMNLDRLTALRKKKKWSLQYTADRLGIAKSTYAGYESGYRRPSLEALVMLAELFDTSCDDLLGRTPQTLPLSNIELTSNRNINITIDKKALSQQEIIRFIAFIRAERQLLAEQDNIS
ncbi:helix-turn-helix transcriptional regulator [Gallibacterium anatis]|uniref:helix-turn-helix domain-containing protein n=2 Tax=Gallibacterium anatis TaxID=750 RepID=UPI0030060FE9